MTDQTPAPESTGTATGSTTGSTGGRRAATAAEPSSRRGLVLALLLPAVAVSGLAFGATRDTDNPGAGATEPESVPLTSLQVVCPGSVGPGGRLAIANPESGSGGVEVRLGEDRSKVSLKTHAVSDVEAAEAPRVVDGRGGLAPGLVAARVQPRQGAATTCLPPAPDYWFTGVGAAGLHSSTLELANPDGGPAIADVTVFGPQGEIEVPRLRGISVPGGTATSIDLATTVPQREDLSLHVQVTRGRLGADLADSVADVGGTDRTTDWLPSQATPSEENVLLGVTPGRGERQLVLVNTAEDQASVSIKVVGPDSTFAPTGFDEISLPPHTTVVTDVSDLVASESRRAEMGLQITSSEPVSVGLREVQDGDLTRVTPAEEFTDAGVVLPGTKSTLVVAAGDRAAAATVVGYDRRGKEVLSERLAARVRANASLDIPARVTLLRVTTDGAPLRGAVRVDLPGGTATWPVSDLVLDGLVPRVSPAG